MLFSAEKIYKNYGMKQLLGGITLYLQPGDKIGIIGVNGTGKSTLLRLLAGLEEPDEGTVTFDPGVRIAYLPQNPVFPPDLGALDYVLSSVSEEERTEREYNAKSILNRLGITDYGKRPAEMSGGQRKRVALAAVLLRESDILLLDEPTNHLDTGMIVWLEKYLAKYTGGLVLVTHDRYFLQNVCNRITELSLAKCYSYEANWEKYLELKLERLESQQASERKRQSILRTERQWMMRGARARSTKNKAHIQRYEELNDRAAPELEESMTSISAGASRLGKKTIELKHIGKSYGGQTVIRDFSYNLLRDDRIGIIGPNGAGKSTLLNVIAGLLLPDSGSVEVGATVSIGYFTQEAIELNAQQRAVDYITEQGSYVETAEGKISASLMMERFLFNSDLQYSLIGRLSGGEKRRLFLLGLLMKAPNVLLLDEPTNDLDIETLTILEDYLQSFPGAVIAVSHDRYFLDKMANHIFVLNGSGEVHRYVGGYSDLPPELYEAKDPSESREKKEKASPLRESREKPVKLKFSFKEQREYETIDADIAAAEDKLKENELCQTEFASDYVRLSELMEERKKLESEYDRLMERWLYLNELKEKIEAQT